MDAITLLKKDHATVKGLFKEVDALGDRANASRRKLADRICKELQIHSQIEKDVFYPAFRERVENTEERNEVLEGYEEHAIVDRLVEELSGLEATDEALPAKLNVLMESVQHHVKEEEKTMFPMAKDMFEQEELDQLGQELAAAKERLMGGAAPEGSAARSRSTRGEVADGGGRTRVRSRS